MKLFTIFIYFVQLSSSYRIFNFKIDRGFGRNWALDYEAEGFGSVVEFENDRVQVIEKLTTVLEESEMQQLDNLMNFIIG